MAVSAEIRKTDLVAQRLKAKLKKKTTKNNFYLQSLAYAMNLYIFFVVIKINAIYSFKNRFQLDKVETGP